jgi:hypothetical protein
MAYMSDAKDRYNAICGATSLSLPLADRAVREAERILAGTEAREFCHEYGTRFVADVPYYEAGFRVDLGLTLAFALAAVLPVLDELADRAVEPFVYAEPEWDDDYNLARVIVNAYTRNRATDAAMEAK